MTKDRIIFFSSGDFGIGTFQYLIESGCNVVGLVTSNDNVKFHDRHIAEIADDYNIPHYSVKEKNLENDEWLVDFLQRLKGDIYCVISFKKLPMKIVNMAHKCAFNVHASILPLLRGAAPINWAIRMGFESTGLTAFVLNDKIDSGDIIANRKVRIKENEKFTTLYKKLADECQDFTLFVINEILQNEHWRDFVLTQPDLSVLSFHSEYKAPKVNKDYFAQNILSCFNFKQTNNLINSVDDIGYPIVLVVTKNGEAYKALSCKIYEIQKTEDDTFTTDRVVSDGKTYMKIRNDTHSFLITKIQLAGKKVMKIEDFLNGFKFFNNEEYKVSILEKDF